MICRSGMLKLQIRRALQSKTLPYAILALMALVTVCFVQSCLMFWGHDRGEIPSAATQWVGNGLRSNAQLISFFETAQSGIGELLCLMFRRTLGLA